MGASFYELLARVLVLLTAIPIHELAHAYAAEKMGDSTARLNKRISLNPLDHIDPIGALMILFIGIGFAKPVPVNSYNFRNRKQGIVITALAGPASNVLLAMVCLAAYKLIRALFFLTGGFFLIGIIMQILFFMVRINITLAVFNLLPIPPLDGWNALSQFIPTDIYWKISQHSNQLIWVVLFCVLFGVFDLPISLLSGVFMFVIDKITFIFEIPFMFLH